MIRLTIILFFLGLILTDIWVPISMIWPSTKIGGHDLWLSAWYHEKVTIAWYIYELAYHFNWLIWTFVFAIFMNDYNERLFQIATVFFGYRYIEFMFYIWNRNSNFFSNCIVYAAMILIVMICVKPFKSFKLKIV